MTDSFEKYTPDNNDIIDHLICRTIPSRISFYYDKNKGNLIGTMTSAYKQMIMSKINLNVGYIDYLCVDKNYRGKNIAGKIIILGRDTKQKTVYFYLNMKGSRGHLFP